MAEQKITLQLKKDITGLADYDYGKSVFDQIQKEIDLDGGSITFIFPNHIERVASSFVQGFFSYIIKKIGYDGFEQKIHIEAANSNLVESIKRNIR